MKARKLTDSDETRHGLLPVRHPKSNKAFQNRYGVFGESAKKFSCRRGWHVRVRIWLKVTLTGDEIIEDLKGVEIPQDQQPREIESRPSTRKEVSWVEKPPLKLYELQQIVESGLRFAEKLIVAKAETLQKKYLIALYPALARLRTYYLQLAEDAPGNDREAMDAIEGEYRRRLNEEIRYTRVKAVMNLVAVETIATPVQKLKWLLERNGKSKEVKAVLNLYDGSLVSPLRCDVCGVAGRALELSDANRLVCADCYAHCDICGAEIVDGQISTNHICAICSRIACSEHALTCTTCGQVVCGDHHHRCLQGCRICPNCIRHCRQCGDKIIWCKIHTAVNSRGEITCRNHTAFCIGCRESFPVGRAATCSSCEQTICLHCTEHCADCGRTFCLSHIEKGRCSTCRQMNSQMTLF